MRAAICATAARWGRMARKAIEAVIGHLEPVAVPEPPDPAGCPIP